MKSNKITNFLRSIPNMTTQASVPDIGAMVEAATAELSTQLSVANTALASQTELTTSLQAKLDSVTAELATLQDVKATLEKQTHEKAMAARKEKLIASVGDTQAEAMFNATAGLDEASFEAIVSAMNAKADAEAKSPAFTEQGATGTVDANAVTEELEASTLEKQLKQKYQSK